MLDKSYEFLYETQNQARPTFFVYLCEKNTLIAIFIAFLVGTGSGAFWGVMIFAVWIWYDIPRITIFREAKLANKHNLCYLVNLLIGRFYRKDNIELTQILSQNILVEKKQ